VIFLPTGNFPVEFSNFPLKLQWSDFFSTGNLINSPLTLFPTEIDRISQWTKRSSPLEFSFLHWSLHSKSHFSKKKNFKNFSKSFFLQSYYPRNFFCQKIFTKDHSKIKFSNFIDFWDLKTWFLILKIFLIKFSQLSLLRSNFTIYVISPISTCSFHISTISRSPRKFFFDSKNI
jgi:hypothetical protein